MSYNGIFSRVDIICAPDPILNMKSQPIIDINDSVRTIARNMLYTMYCNVGIGLAGVQIGILSQIIVIDINDDTPVKQLRNTTPINEREMFVSSLMKSRISQMACGKVLCMINPRITKKSKATFNFDEGCLSLPGVKADTVRLQYIEVKYMDYNGKRCRIATDDHLFSACLQHEIDHLNGVTLLDHMCLSKKDNLE